MRTNPQHPSTVDPKPKRVDFRWPMTLLGGRWILRIGAHKTPETEDDTRFCRSSLLYKWFCVRARYADLNALQKKDMSATILIDLFGKHIYHAFLDC